LTGFRLGRLPDGSGTTVMVSLPGGRTANGTYAQIITTDREPVGGVITATRVVKLAARTEFPKRDAGRSRGLVTAAMDGSVNDLSFAVEGKRCGGNRHEFGVAPGTTSGKPSEGAGPWDGKRGVLSAARIVFR